MSREIEVRAAGGQPSARITIGQAQFGKFGIYRFEADKKTFSTIGVGHTPPGLQEFPMGAADQLNGRFLQWDVIVAPFAGGDGQLFAVTMDIVQDGKVVATFSDTGQFTGATPKQIRTSASIAAK